MHLISTVLAQGTGVGDKVTISGDTTGLANVTIPQIISWAVVTIIVVAAIIFFFMLILGGIRWILSGGDKANTEAARNQITAALIGLIIIFAAWAIIQLVQGVFGVDIFSNLTFSQIGGGGGGGGGS